MMQQKKHWARDVLGHYTSAGPLDEETILAMAEDIYGRHLERCGDVMSDPGTVEKFLRARIGCAKNEHFVAVWLDTRHRPITVDTLFTGSIDGCAVHPREVVRRALQTNSACLILAHNHPSGSSVESQADRQITTRLQEALALIEVRVLDHLIITAGSCTSFAARGWL
jgi:DNA repair protein RadC